MSDSKKEFIRALKFTLFSISAAGIQILADVICNELIGLPGWLSYLISLVLSVLWNFTLNRKFTFQSANNVPVAMLKVAAFYLVFTPLSTWWTAVLTTGAGWTVICTQGLGWNEYVVLAATMIINFVSEYLYNRFVVFGASLDTAKK
jgi:putative flippase GtrA